MKKKIGAFKIKGERHLHWRTQTLTLTSCYITSHYIKRHHIVIIIKLFAFFIPCIQTKHGLAFFCPFSRWRRRSNVNVIQGGWVTKQQSINIGKHNHVNRKGKGNDKLFFFLKTFYLHACIIRIMGMVEAVAHSDAMRCRAMQLNPFFLTVG